METKHCSDCGEARPVGEFDVCRSRKSGLQHYCRKHKQLRVAAGRAKDPQKHIAADRRRRRESYANDPEKYLKAMKAWKQRRPKQYKAAIQRARLKYRYGLTTEAYVALVHAANGRCQLCKRKKKKLHIDHDHKTGKVRGLLCMTCNQGLGKLGDTLERLREAVAYLQNNA